MRDHAAQQNGVEHGGFACENTVYTITGFINRTNAALSIVHTNEDAPTVTFNVVFKDLTILGEDWCSVLNFDSARGAAVAVAVMLVIAKKKTAPVPGDPEATDKRQQQSEENQK